MAAVSGYAELLLFLFLNQVPISHAFLLGMHLVFFFVCDLLCEPV
jgi:hypothetical protein|tara:strand:- start:765 stop:899 length:135 start_codon:yes stop_codon:yes gene_type:complete